MLLFRSEEHVQNWCRQWKMDFGALLTLEQAWGLAYAWYSPDRRLRDWQRKTVDEVEALLAELGLTSPYWNLH